MTTVTFALTEARTVTVKLSDVPLELRREVADLLVRRDGLTGVEALEMMLCANWPKQDPTLEVTEDKAHAVLVRHKQPRGSTPRFD